MKMNTCIIIKWQNKFTVCLIGVHIEIQKEYEMNEYISQHLSWYTSFTQNAIFSSYTRWK